MVVPLGVGIGDVIGVAKLAKSVVTEIKKKKEALTEYRGLLLELDLLAQILDQIDGQAGNLEGSDNQFELIQACCAACREPLEKFLLKISKFEPSLGVWAKDGEVIKGVGRQIQWKVAYEEDVRDLRAILMGHMVRTLLCQNLQLSDSVRASKKDDTEKFHHLQRLVKEHHTLLESLSNSQKTIHGDSESHQRTILDRIDQCKRQIIGLANANDTVFKDLGIKIDESLKSGAESQRKIDGQVDILRGIQAQATSQSNYHPSSQEVTAESQAKSLIKPPNTLTNSLAIFMVILASSNAALSYKLTKQNGVDLQRPVQYVAKARNVTVQSQEYKECHPVATPAMISSHQAQSTEPSAGHTSLEKHSLISRGKDESWEALWNKSKDSIGAVGGLGGLKIGSKYENLSFFFRVDSLAPNYHAQPARHDINGWWVPPNIRTGYTRTNGDLFRWVGGTTTHIARGDSIGRSLHSTHSAMTVFTQNPDTPHLLCVPFDAERTHVGHNPGGWRPLAFRHIQADSSQRTFSALSINGDRQHIAAPGSPRWIPQLLPNVYDCQSGNPKLRDGLIGSLPLLLALAAFSAPPTALIEVLTKCSRPRLWKPHKYQYPAGHLPERGMVVTIFFDLWNPEGSNARTLNKLQNGGFGPFYS